MEPKSQLLLFVGIFVMGALGFAVVQARRMKWSKRRRGGAARRGADSDGGAPPFYPWMFGGHDGGSSGREHAQSDPTDSYGSESSAPDADSGSGFDAGGGFDGGGGGFDGGGGGGGDGGGGGGD